MIGDPGIRVIDGSIFQVHTFALLQEDHYGEASHARILCDQGEAELRSLEPEHGSVSVVVKRERRQEEDVFPLQRDLNPIREKPVSVRSSVGADGRVVMRHVNPARLTDVPGAGLVSCLVVRLEHDLLLLLIVQSRPGECSTVPFRILICILFF